MQRQRKYFTEHKKLRDTGIYVNEDFSEETMKIRNNLRADMKKLRAEGKFCIIKYDRLFVRTFKNQDNGLKSIATTDKQTNSEG